MIGEIDHLLYFHPGLVSVEDEHQILISASKNHALNYIERSNFYKTEMINRNTLYGFNFEEHIRMLNAPSSNFDDSSVVKIGNSLFKVYREQDTEQLNNLINTLLSKNIKKGSELETLMMSYISVAIRRQYGLDSFNQIMNIQKFYNYRFESEMQKPSAKLSVVRYHNTVDMLGNYLSLDQAIEFVNRWIENVETPNKNETKDLAYSQIYFINREFKKMQPFSRYIAFNNYGQKTRAWLHNIICLFVFRKEDYNLAIQSIKSFKNYIKRNQKNYSKIFYHSNMNLAILMEKLIKNDFNPQEINLNDYKKVFYKTWISEEVEKAKKK